MTKYRLPDGRIVDEDDVPGYLDEVYTEDDHKEFINDAMNVEELFEAFQVKASAIRRLSPTDFRLGYIEEIDFMYEDREDGSLEPLGIEKKGNRWKLPNGKVVSDDALYDCIPDYYSEDDYEEYLDEMSISEINYHPSGAGDFFYEYDYYSFRQDYLEYLDNVSEEDYEFFGIVPIEGSDNCKPKVKRKAPAKKPAKKRTASRSVKAKPKATAKAKKPVARKKTASAPKKGVKR